MLPSPDRAPASMHHRLAAQPHSLAVGIDWVPGTQPYTSSAGVKTRSRMKSNKRVPGQTAPASGAAKRVDPQNISRFVGRTDMKSIDSLLSAYTGQDHFAPPKAGIHVRVIIPNAMCRSAPALPGLPRLEYVLRLAQ